MQKYSNCGISTTSTAEGSHGALKGALPSSSGTLHTATKIINRKGTERSQQLSIETSTLCTAISRPALEMVYAEAAKKLQHQEKDGTTEKCSCTIRSQLGLPIDVTSIHPRWRVQTTLPDPLAAIPRKGRPKGTRRLKTSAEIVQLSSDRIEKVRRSGHDRRSCPKLNKQYPQGIEGRPGPLSQNDSKEERSRRVYR
ncbi:hypothetical protein V1506DRAFT_569289 [Lipomyces tetrasporus]